MIRYPKLIKKHVVIQQALGSIDFLPTLCTMTKTKPINSVHGRDFSELLSQNKPIYWKDIAIVRGTGDLKGWLMAVSDRYKLVVSANDPMWFFDLERDPNEMINLRDHAGYRETIKAMAAELISYGKKFNEPFVKQPQIESDLKWSVSAIGKYPKS